MNLNNINVAEAVFLLQFSAPLRLRARIIALKDAFFYGCHFETARKKAIVSFSALISPGGK